MAKSSKPDLSEVSHDDLIAELSTRLNASGGSEETFPSAEEIDDMDTDALQELCEKVSIDFEDKDDDELKGLLKTVQAIGSGETDDLDDKEVKALCLACGVKPSKDKDKNVEALQTFLSESTDGSDKAESEDAEEESEDKEEESEDADEEEEESDEDEEEIDTAEVVKKSGKYPKEEIMLKRLKLFNAKAGKNAIDIKKAGGARKAYAKLLERLVDIAGELADWGSPYVREGSGWCCGLPMKDTKFKSDKTEYGKCLVTDKVYSFDSDENVWNEKE